MHLLWLHDGNAPAADHLEVVAPPPSERWWSLVSEHELLALADTGRRWAVAGVGIGGQAAVRLALRHPGRFPVAAAIDAAFDFHDLHGRGSALDDLFPTRERARQDTAVLHVDPCWWPPHVSSMWSRSALNR